MLGSFFHAFRVFKEENIGGSGKILTKDSAAKNKHVLPPWS